jgi:Ca-activated chloride channel family protein
MRRLSLRSALASLLILAFVISLWPALAADAPAFAQTARRGKNGSVTTPTVSRPADRSAPATTQRRADDRDNNAAPNQAATDTDPTDAEPQPNNDQRLQPDKGAQSDTRNAQSSSPAPSANRKPEPPPFDRPPINSGSTSPTTQRNTQATTDNNSRPDDSTGRAPSRSTDAPTSSTSRSASTSRSSGPPVLRRPSTQDSRSGSARQTSPDRQGDDSVFSNDPAHSSGRNRDRAPVLRRPSDPQDEERAPDQQRRSSGQGDRQPPDQPADGGDDQVVKLESTLVNIPLLVSDRSGRYIPRLSKNDFTLYEDGVQQEIASFGSEEVPFNVALLLDVSPSVEGDADAIQDAALAFVRQLRPQDRVMVVSFDKSTHFLCDFTSDRYQLERAIRTARIGSGTSVYDAVYEVVSQRLRGVEGRKAMILFSDGEDTTSHRASYDDAINIVTESDVLVYGLRYPGTGGGGGGYGNPWPRSPFPRGPWPGIQLPLPFPWPRSRRNGPYGGGGGGGGRSWGGKDFMKDITEAGGGPVYDAERVGDMSGLASRIADELRHVYVLSYYPKNPLSNGGYRAIRVRVNGRDDIAVRHRRGYNAREMSSPSRT